MTVWYAPIDFSAICPCQRCGWMSEDCTCRDARPARPLPSPAEQRVAARLIEHPPPPPAKRDKLRAYRRAA